MGDSDTAADEHNGSHSPTGSVQPQMTTMHPITYSGMPMHMYPFPPGMVPAQPPRTKRRQVKNACTNCQKACKKCDDARPCLRCVKYGIAEECIDSQRKERQKGIKRGPYKKRDGKDRAATSVDQPQLDVQAVPQAIPMPAAVAAPAPTPPIPYVHPMGYPPPGFFGQYPMATGKPGETQVYYPQFYLAPMPPPPPPPTGQDGEPTGYPPHQMYPATFLAPYAAQHAYAMPYMFPQAARPDGQPMAMPAAHHYAPYPPPQYIAKPPSRGPESGYHQQHQQMMDGRRDARAENGRMGDGMHASHGKQT